MSTYSWSYKTASHRQAPAKKITDEDDKNVPVPPLKTKQSVGIHNLKNSQSERPKRLNWKAKIYVGNLNKKTNEASLAYYFSVFGDIDDVKLIRDHNTNESRGFAFITFEKIESGEITEGQAMINVTQYLPQTLCFYYARPDHVGPKIFTLDDNSITVASAERKVPKIKSSKEHGPPRDPSQTLFWEFKWNNEPGSEVYGPYETSLMLAWKNQGYFDGGCWVRQVIHTACSVEEKDSDTMCEPTPAKKLKLVIEYSDSDEEETSEVNDENKETEREQERDVEKKAEETIEKSVAGIGEGGLSETNTQIEKEEELEKEQLNEREESKFGKRTEEGSNHEIEKEKTNNDTETMSSDDEYLPDNTEDLSTEFVAISEIDFNFFP